MQEEPRKFRYQSSFNSTEKEYTCTAQHGGTVTTITDALAHHVIKRGCYSSGLGRWSWILLQGRHTTKVRIINAYRPYKSDEENSVMMQQYRHFKKENRRNVQGHIVNPRTVFYNDLKKEIKEWKEQGGHIIVGIDANEDIRTGETEKTFKDLDMNECILLKHNDKSPPATNNRNTKRQPIVGIFTTPGIVPIRAGYLPFGEGGISDHRSLWVDFNYVDLLGYQGVPLAILEPRRLSCKIPRIKEKYKKLTRKMLIKTGIMKELQQINNEASLNGK